MLALTDHLGQDVVDARGRRVGRLRDLAVRLDEPFPAVVAAIVESGKTPARIDWQGVATFEGSQVTLRDSGMGPAQVQQDELWLARDVVDHQVVDLDGRRVARVGDVELTREDSRLRVVGVDIGLATLARRLGLRRLARRLRGRALPWDEIHMASGRGHELQLRAPASAVHRLAPEELIHLVGRLPVARGAEVLRAVPAASAAGALGGSRPEVAAGLLRELGPAQTSDIVGRIPVDDLAAVLRSLDEGERERVLAGVEPGRADTVRPLLAQAEDTAGAIMTPRVRTARADEPLEAVRGRLAADPPEVEGLLNVVVVDGERRPLGVIPARALLAGHGEPIDVPPVRTDTPLDDVIELFATYDVLAVPVVDASGVLVGAVAIDDLLDVTLAERLPGGSRYRPLAVRQRAPS